MIMGQYKHLLQGLYLFSLLCIQAVNVSATPTTPQVTTQRSASNQSIQSQPNACIGLRNTCDSTPKEASKKLQTKEKNILNKAIKICSLDPLTGFERDGRCLAGPHDRGVHVVCAQMTNEFLAFTRKKGNDLSTPKPRFNFPGLQSGDRWCLCASRWVEAVRAGVAPPVVLESTAIRALEFADQSTFEKYAVNDHGSPRVSP